VYIVYLFTQGREEGGEMNQKEGERGNSSQLSRVENTMQLGTLLTSEMTAAVGTIGIS
jgi:hypothetical protein